MRIDVRWQRGGPSAFLAIVVLVALSGCYQKKTRAARLPTPAAPVESPDLGPGRAIEPGILVHEVTLQPSVGRGQVWIYLPDKPKETPLPVVLVAPAGSILVTGMELGDGDRQEHLPYVRAGFAVVAYALDGHVDLDRASDPQVGNAATLFIASDAGLVNARNALNYALAKVPTLDRKRIWIAGHSSAATHALYVSSQEPRIAACAAYAPCTDAVKRGGEAVNALQRYAPELRDFVARTSPLTQVAQVRCPTFLFHALDDSNVPVSETQAFAAELKKTNQRVTVVLVPKGNHHTSMIQEGIPKAIQWFKRLPKD